MTEEKKLELAKFKIQRQAELKELLLGKDEVINNDFSGIYAIYCPVTFRTYIGQAKNIRNRWGSHLKLLEKNKHYNRKLQKAWNMFESKLLFLVLEECEVSDLDDREHYYIKYYRTKYSGLNVRGKKKPNKLV